MKMKLREQRQNYVVRYRKLMEKIELDGKEILKRYLEIGKVMQAKANKEVHMRSKKMLEDKLKQKTLLVENIGNLRSEIQASGVKSNLKDGFHFRQGRTRLPELVETVWRKATGTKLHLKISKP